MAGFNPGVWGFGPEGSGHNPQGSGFSPEVSGFSAGVWGFDGEVWENSPAVGKRGSEVDFRRFSVSGRRGQAKKSGLDINRQKSVASATSPAGSRGFPPTAPSDGGTPATSKANPPPQPENRRDGPHTPGLPWLKSSRLPSSGRSATTSRRSAPVSCFDSTHCAFSSFSSSALAFFVSGCSSPSVFRHPSNARRPKTSDSTLFPCRSKASARL